MIPFRSFRHIVTALFIAHAAIPQSMASAIPAGKSQALASPDQVPEGLAKSDWSSIRAAHDAWQHEFREVDGKWQAHNPGQQWTMKFDGHGFLAQPKDADWQWGLEFESYGFGEQQTNVGGTPTVRNEGQRLTYQWDDCVQEWFINDSRGLEHGFIIAQRPFADGDLSSSGTPLSFTLSTRGTLRPSISSDSLSVHFRDASNAPVLNYSGLKVWDADGKILASRFETVGGNQVRLLVEENGARYPLTIDPIAQQAFLKAGNTPRDFGTNDGFGYSISVQGDTIVVGARDEDSASTGVDSVPNESASASGAAFVFVRSGPTWSQQAYLKASNTGAGDSFGYSVAVDGDILAVGAPSEDSGTNGIDSTPNESALNSGAVYIFVRSGNTWSQQAYVKTSNPGSQDSFGNSVAVSGDTVAIGAPSEDSSTNGINSTPNESAGGSGAAYVFTRSANIWSQQAYIKSSNVGAGDAFGWSVAASGDTVVVGAVSESSSTTGVNSTPNDSLSSSGAAYVFLRSSGTWIQQAYIKSSNPGSNDNFGWSVAVSGNTAVVGAPFEDSGTNGVNSVPNDAARDSGASYVFFRSGSSWIQQAYIKASNTGALDQFGRSVAVSGDVLVAGANQESCSTTGINSAPNEGASTSGAAYVFLRSGVAWTQQAYLKASNTASGDSFGWAVSASADTVVAGALYEDSATTGVNSPPSESATDSGAAYVFVRSGGSWSQQAYLKAGNNGGPPSDSFGSSVAVSNDTVVVGAPGEDSSTGVNSTPDESATNSGAAYVFVRSGVSWSQQAYLKASNPGTDDAFGMSVAISGDTVVVGAFQEDSSTPGVNINNTPNESASNSGAAYVFVRTGTTTWTQQAYIKASNPGVSDSFGHSVSASGDTVVVGAHGEDSSTIGVNSTPNENASSSGAAYVFVRIAGNWSQQAYLKASNTQASDTFGFSVSTSGETVVVGANGEDSSTAGSNSTPNESAENAGAAYVFLRSGTNWSQQAYLKASNSGANDSFGERLSVSGDTIIVGASGEDSSTTGVNSTPNNTFTDSGAAYLFARNGSVWNQQAYIKASNPGAQDYFGSSVAVSGDTVAIGASGEDSSTNGINSTPNESASGSGAAYIFVRLGTNWSQQAYLKSSNAGASDNFGTSVSVSGETVVCGAKGEQSSTSGINSITNESAVNSGAAYIFSGLGPPPAISVRGNSIPIANGDITPSSTDFTNFGSIAAASGNVTRTFAISNSGSGTLSLTGTPKVALTGSNAIDFAVTAEPTSPIAGGGSTTFTVTFDPSATGLRTATVSIANDDPTKNPFTFSIQGTGLNTSPVITSNGGAAAASINVAENSTTIITVTATDPDLPAQTLSYSITGGADAAKFSIGSSSGEIAFASAQDFESPTDAGANNEYDLTVTVTDNGAPTLSVSQAISVTIANVNEAPSNITLSASSLAEDVPANTTVGDLSSADPDSSDSFTYSLVSGSGSSDNSAFTITGATLKINSTPVFATQSSYAIRIRSTDSGGLFLEKPFTITVTGSAVVFTDWAATAGLVGPNAALTATPFNDSVPNLLKYAFNMNASGPDVSVLTPGGSSGLPQVLLDESGEEPVLKVEFLRRKGSGLVYTPERATSLDAFTAMTGSQTVTPINSEWERVSVIETNPPTSTSSSFARVRVTIP